MILALWDLSSSFVLSDFTAIYIPRIIWNIVAFVDDWTTDVTYPHCSHLKGKKYRVMVGGRLWSQTAWVAILAL